MKPLSGKKIPFLFKAMTVTPAKAGVHAPDLLMPAPTEAWIPAFAGMTRG